MTDSMLSRRHVLFGTVVAGALAATGSVLACTASGAPRTPAKTFEVNHTDEEWRHLLSGPQYDVLRTAGTERPFSSPLNDEHRSGTFNCAELSATPSSSSRTTAPEWPVPKCSAAVAADTSATSSTTARHRPDCATA
jgi:peptide-methionine (R)-S-oxide reductase